MSNNMTDGTLQSSHLSATSATLSPAWARPRSPLPPHRLAKLANALGVSTPMPAIHHPSPLMSSSHSSLATSSPPSDNFRRSPTPSTTSSHTLVPSSKYLLHVVPPLHLPHHSNSLDDSGLIPPPPNTPGYHTQFRRGTLVPVHATLQSQLGAIAKEYALPSTAGMILYLVSTSGRSPPASPTSRVEPLEHDAEEPGPRLSEDVWNHLWTRVLRAEQRDEKMANSSWNQKPDMFGLGMGLGFHSSPYLPQNSSPSLRPLFSAPSMQAPQPQITSFTPSPSTSSSTSDIRSHTKSAPPSSASFSHSEPVTPGTSSTSNSFHESDLLSLPGLHSPSIIPVLCKVEFDIDRRKAGWYEPWLRSRRMNHAKRAESRASRKESEVEGAEESEERKAPLELKLTSGPQVASPVSFTFSFSPAQDASSPRADAAQYEPLSESVDDDTGSESGDLDQEEYLEDSTARVASLPAAKDPLSDVFGTDADTWADLRNSQYGEPKNKFNSNIVELALTGADLADLPSPMDLEEEHVVREEDEVEDILDKMTRPHLSVTIPPAPPAANKRESSLATQKKHIPPPLVLPPVSDSDSTLSEPGHHSKNKRRSRLPYLAPSEEPLQCNEDGSDDELTRMRSSAESEKRAGGVFDDLDLGFDSTEDFDDGGPHDYRKSQYLMKAQLDEIEKTLVQFSPRNLTSDEHIDQHSSPSASRSSSHMQTQGRSQSPEMDLENESDSYSDLVQQAWPAVPFVTRSEPTGSPRSALSAGLPSAPPRLAVNGVAASAPKSFIPNTRSSPAAVSVETEIRKRDLEEQQALHNSSVRRNTRSASHSPVTTLSSDPFGRSSMEAASSAQQLSQAVFGDSVPKTHVSPLPFEALPERRPSLADVDEQNRHSRAHSGAHLESSSSRFSADSVNGGDPTSKTTKGITVKTIKNLWRKSNKTPVSGIQATLSLDKPPQPPPPRPERPSQEQLDFSLPSTPTFGVFSPQPPPPRPERPPQEQPAIKSVPVTGRSLHPAPIVASQMQPSREDSVLDRFHFDQESPYPTRRSSAARHHPPSPPPFLPPFLPPQPEKDKSSVRKSILKTWKSANGNAPQNSTSEPRSSAERSNSNGAVRVRRPTGTSRGSVVSPPPDIPPSPKIPEQFINARMNGPTPDHRQSIRSKKMPSTDYSHYSTSHAHTQPPSPSRAITSSQGSGDRRPSFDVSQFEIISPKTNASLSYPYHGLDHD